jgi:hypothetical protein
LLFDLEESAAIGGLLDYLSGWLDEATLSHKLLLSLQRFLCFEKLRLELFILLDHIE